MEKETWRQNLKQENSNTVGRRRDSRQGKIELDGEKWSVEYAPQGLTQWQQEGLWHAGHRSFCRHPLPSSPLRLEVGAL